MKTFLKDNLLPVLVTGLVSLLAFLTYNTIHNTSRIDLLVHDIGEIKDSLRTIVKIMTREERNGNIKERN